MDFLGVIQFVFDVTQYPDSYKEEIERLKSECKSLSQLISMVGENELSENIKNQIRRHLEEAETLLKNVPKKHNFMQSFISMLPGQTNVQKIKETSDNIHRTKNDLTAELNARMFLSKQISLDQSDLKYSNVKRINSSEQETNFIMNTGQSKYINQSKMPATLMETLDPTLEGKSDNNDDEDGLFQTKKIKITLTLDKTSNIYKLFEDYKINTKENFNLKPGSCFKFERIKYLNLENHSEQYKKYIGTISRYHASLELLEVEHQSEVVSLVSSLLVPLTIGERSSFKKSDQVKASPQDDDIFATCKEVISDEEGEEMFGNTTAQTPIKKQKMYFVVITCKGNGIFIYRKSENQEKLDEIKQNNLLRDINDLKQIKTGQWEKIEKQEKALVFNNDSIAIFKNDYMTISYTIKIEQ